MSFESFWQEVKDKYLNSVEGKNFVKGELALVCLRDAIAYKIDAATKIQFKRHAENTMKLIAKMQKSGEFKCKAVTECSDYANLCTACNRKFYDKMKYAIQNITGKRNISCTNTMKEGYFLNHCDFAKCFIPIGGYRDRHNIQDIDCSSLMHIVINNKEIHKHFGDINTFSEILTLRNNQIAHKEFRVNTENLESAIDNMIKLLNEQMQVELILPLHLDGTWTRQQQYESDEAFYQQVLAGTSGAVAQTQMLDPLLFDCTWTTQLEDISADSYGQHLSVNFERAVTNSLETDDLEIDAMPVPVDDDGGHDSNVIESVDVNVPCEDSSQQKQLLIMSIKQRKEVRKTIEYLKHLKEANYHITSKDLTSSTLESLICSSMPSDHWEVELKANESIMPPELKLGYVDGLILYCKKDRKDVLKFQKHLQNDIKVQKGAKVDVILYDGPEITALGTTVMHQLQTGIDHSTFIFLYMTKNFVDDSWSRFYSESALIKRIEEEKWRVIPVWTENRKETFDIPFGLNALKGVHYYLNNEFYKEGMSNLFNSMMTDKFKRNEENKMEQKKWLENKKKERDELAQKERDTESLEDRKTKLLKKMRCLSL